MNHIKLLQEIDQHLLFIDEREIASRLNKFLSEEQDNLDGSLLAEIMAFELSENNKDDLGAWGTYFGPMYVVNNSNGNSIESPSIKLITPLMVQYWNSRIPECRNHLLIARYAGLVWDFKYRITGEQPSHQICRVYINALIKVSKLEMINHIFNGYIKLERALELSIELNDTELTANCKHSLIEFEKKYAQDEKPGFWGFSYDLLIGNKKVHLTQEEERLILNDLELRLIRLTNTENPDSKIDIWAAEYAANRLASYYRKKDEKVQVQRVLLRLGKGFNLLINNGPKMQASSLTEQLYNIYKSFGLHEEAHALLIQLRELGPKLAAEMQTISHKIELPKDKIETYTEAMVQGSINDFLNRFVTTYIPRKEETKEEIIKMRKDAPMMYLFGTTIQDAKGRAIAKIGSLDQDMEGHIINENSKNFTFSSLFIRLIFLKAKTKFDLSSKHILDFVKTSPIIDQQRLCIITKAIDAYFKNDHIVFIHLLIPQMEEAMRNLVERAGGNVLKQARGGSFQLKSFDEILRDDIIYQSLGDDFASYFRTLFTDPRGWNLRNNVCHGLKEAEMFTPEIADRLLHSLLCLGMIRLNAERN